MQQQYGITYKDAAHRLYLAETAGLEQMAHMIYSVQHIRSGLERMMAGDGMDGGSGDDSGDGTSDDLADDRQLSGEDDARSGNSLAET